MRTQNHGEAACLLAAEAKHLIRIDISAMVSEIQSLRLDRDQWQTIAANAGPDLRDTVRRPDAAEAVVRKMHRRAYPMPGTKGGMEGTLEPIAADANEFFKQEKAPA